MYISFLKVRHKSVRRSRNASASTASDNTSADEGECSSNSTNANASTAASSLIAASEAFAASAKAISTAEVELSSEAATESLQQKSQKDEVASSAHAQPQRPQRGEFTTATPPPSEATATPTIPAGSRLIRPRLLVSPSSARSSNKEPLQIEIPKSKVKVPSKGGGREPSVGVGGGLLMAKNKASSSGNQLHYGKRKVFEFTDDDDDEAELEMGGMADFMSTCVLAGSDAHSIAGAVIGALTVSPPPPNHDGGEEGEEGEDSSRVANGIKAGKQAQQSSSLKTVIRLPAAKPFAAAAAAAMAAKKPAPPGGKASLAADSSAAEQPKKRGRPPGSTSAGRSSASPTDDQQPHTPPAPTVSRPADKPPAANTAASARPITPNAAEAEAEKLSMVVPEKASSYNIHPERCCSDVCHYCSMKFGMLDTPLHVSQMKSEEVQRLACEFAKVTRDACLCDKCFRFIDRGAKTKRKERLSGSSSSKSSRFEMTSSLSDPHTREDRMRMCVIRNCTREVTATVSKKWLIRLRKKLNAKKVLSCAILIFNY